jgi:hypothetical protein
MGSDLNIKLYIIEWAGEESMSEIVCGISEKKIWPSGENGVRGQCGSVKKESHAKTPRH